MLGISALMIGFITTLHGAANPTNVANCIVDTKAQLKYIRTQIESYASKNDRLPVPARRDVGPDSPIYGRENTTTNGASSNGADITQANGLYYGALPFQTLGLPIDYAADCWGNKYTYAVMTAFTSASTTGGYRDNTLDGAITLKQNAATANTKMAYVVLSHGPDELGAVKAGYAISGNQGWCNGAAMNAINCLGSNAVSATFMDADYNDGKDAGANYFDDLIIAGIKQKQLVNGTISVFGWGSNANSLISPLATRWTPTLINTQVAAKAMDSGNGFSGTSCIIDTSNAAYCWGQNTYGQVGDGTKVTRFAPTLVAGGISFSKISPSTVASYGHTCGLDMSGAAYCWGYNAYGQLGDGTTTDRLAPTLVTGGLVFTAISTGGYNTCGLTATNQLYCWGSNYSAQMGNGAAGTTVATPTLVAGYNFSTVTVGFNSICALDMSGYAYCWGSNAYYSMGNGAPNNSPAYYATPQAVPGGRTYSNLTLGGYSIWGVVTKVCGITATSAKELYCWGTDYFNAYPTPTLISTGYTFTSVAIGSMHNCGLTAQGAVYCWGYNYNGQLGINNNTNQTTAQPVMGGKLYKNIIARGATTCAQGKDDDQIYCWGASPGDGSAASYYTISAGQNSMDFTSIVKGTRHACGLNSSGEAWCWGENTYNQLGTGNNTSSTTPVAVTGGLKFTSLYAQGFTTCGLTDTGAAYCWGDNFYGQIGDNTQVSKNVPTAVSGGLTFNSLTRAFYHTCGIAKTGVSYCWGRNTYGQLGDGTNTDNPVPTTVTGGLTFTQLSAKASYGSDEGTCGLDAAGKAYCWGYDWNSLGTGNMFISSPAAVTGGYTFTALFNGNLAIDAAGNAYKSTAAPNLIPGGYTFRSLARAQYATCGVTTTGKVYCWGTNANGELGDNTMTSHATPALVTGTGAAPYLITNLVADTGSDAFLTTALNTGTCDTPGFGKANSGQSTLYYNTLAPFGACGMQYRFCTAGVLSGSYLMPTCTPGCDARTIVSGSCTGDVPAMAGGGSQPVTITTGSGALTASCSTMGVVTITGSCS